MPADDSVKQKNAKTNAVEPVSEVEEATEETRGLTAAKGRPTPSRRQLEEEQDEPQGNFLTRFIRGVAEYFQGVRSEVDKVVWPTRPETRRLSTVVIIVLIVAAIILGIISGVFAELFRLGLQNPLVLIVFMFLGAGVLYLIGRFVFGASQESRY